MLREAFQLLIDTGKNSAPQIVAADAEPRHVYYLRNKEGELAKVTASPSPDKHQAISLQAIIQKAIDEKATATVWCSYSKIVTVFGEDKRSTATLELVNSAQFLKLCGWNSTKPALTQADVIREFRTTFYGCLGRAGNLVDVLKKVNFRATSSTQGEVGHGKASLGKEVTGEVTGVGNIPEYITFDFPLYANACFRNIRSEVTCALEPDAGTGTFRIIPIPGQLEIANDTGLTAIAAQIEKELEESGVGMFFGNP